MKPKINNSKDLKRAIKNKFYTAADYARERDLSYSNFNAVVNGRIQIKKVVEILQADFGPFDVNVLRK